MWTIVTNTSNLGAYTGDKRARLAFNWNSTFWRGGGVPPAVEAAQFGLFLPWRSIRLELWDVTDGSIPSKLGGAGGPAVVRPAKPTNGAGWGSARERLGSALSVQGGIAPERFFGVAAAGGEYAMNPESWPALMASLSNYASPVNEELGLSSFHPLDWFIEKMELSPEEADGLDDDEKAEALKNKKKDIGDRLSAGARIALVPVPLPDQPGEEELWTLSASDAAGPEQAILKLTHKDLAGFNAEIQVQGANSSLNQNVWVRAFGGTRSYLPLSDQFDSDEDSELRKRNWRKDYAHNVQAHLNLLAWWREKNVPAKNDWATLRPLLEAGLLLLHDRADLGLRFGVEEFDLDEAGQSGPPLQDGAKRISEHIFLRLAKIDPGSGRKVLDELGVGPGLKGKNEKFLQHLRDGKEQNWVGLVTMAVEQWGEDSLAVKGRSTSHLHEALRFLSKPGSEDEFKETGIDGAKALEELERVADDEDIVLDLFIVQWEQFVAKHGGAGSEKHWRKLLGADRLMDRRGELQELLRDSGRTLREWLGDGLTAELWFWREKENGKMVSKGLHVPDGTPQNAKSEAKAVQEAIVQGMKRLWNIPTTPPFRVPVLRTTKSEEKDFPAPGAEAKEAIEEMVVRLATPSELRRTMPHPLRVDTPMLTTPAKQLAEMAGVLVFLRRKGEKGGKKEGKWRCLNMAKLLGTVDGNELVLGKPAEQVVSPFQVNSVNGVLQGVIEYQERPIAVELLEAIERMKRDSEVEGEEIDPMKMVAGLELSYRQLDKVDPAGWGVVPPMIYSKEDKPNFEVAFAPVHNSGALPPDLADSPDTPGQIGAFGTIDKPAGKQIASYGPYRRRVPVGAVRFSGSRDKEGNWAKFQPRMAPSSVAPLVHDLIEPDQTEAGTAGDRRKDLTTYVLWPGVNGAQNRIGNSTVEFLLRPPAVEVENWARGFVAERYQEGGSLDPTDQELLMDVEDAYFELVDEDETARGSKADDLIDDYAVSMVKVEFEEVEMPGQKVELKKMAVLFSQGAVEEKAPTGREFLDRIQRIFRATDGAPAGFRGWLVVERGDAGSKFKVGFPQAEGNENKKDPNRWHLTIPPGRIVKMTVTPCLSLKAKNHFDVIYSEDGPNKELKAVDGDKAFEVIPAAREFYFETVPSARIINKVPKPALPTPKETWNAITLGTTSAGRLSVNLPVLKAEGDGAYWRYVGAIETGVQPWRWLGRIQAWEKQKTDVNGKLLPSRRPRLCENVELLNKKNEVDQLEPVLANELADFEGVAPNDAFTHGGPGSDRDGDGIDDRVNLMKAIQEQKEFPLFEDPGDQEVLGRYMRVRLKLWSRYLGLPGFSDTITSKWSEVSKGGKRVVASSFKRMVLPGRLRTPLGAPRVKMLIPLIEDAPRTSMGGEGIEGRPGFLALTTEGLASPFHILEGAIEFAEYEIFNADTNTLETRYFPEFGPDPISSANSFVDGDDEINQKKGLDKAAKEKVDAEPLQGRAFGLTVEREGADAAFPYAAFSFDFPKLPDGVLPNGRMTEAYKSDIFLKLAFRWRIWSGEDKARTMDHPAEELVGPLTSPWQIRMLAPSAQIEIDPGGDVAVESLRFLPARKRLFIKHANKEVRVIAPKYQGSTGIGNLTMTFAFLTWKTVPDVLSGNLSKLPVGIYLPGVNKEWEPVWLRAEGGRPDRGQFLLLMTRRQRGEDQTVGEILKVAAVNGDYSDRLMAFSNALFPEQGRHDSEEEYQPATMMVVRAFKPIDVESAES